MVNFDFRGKSTKVLFGTARKIRLRPESKITKVKEFAKAALDKRKLKNALKNRVELKSMMLKVPGQLVVANLKEGIEPPEVHRKVSAFGLVAKRFASNKIAFTGNPRYLQFLLELRGKRK